MEMTIDDVIAELNEHADLLRSAATELCKYQMFKTDYEARLKADLVAMLTEIQLEIEELKNKPHCCEHYVRGINNSSNVIQQKIDALKAESEKNDGNVDDN